jgi:hypothetical protein
VNLFRTFVIREPLAAVRQEIRFRGLLSQHDRRLDFLAPRWMRHAEADGLGNRRMREKHFVHLAR